MGQFTRFTGLEEVDVPAQTLHTLSYKASIQPKISTMIRSNSWLKFEYESFIDKDGVEVRILLRDK
jgi:hypothetical protein